MPPNTVYVGRPTKWGNPFVVGEIYYDYSENYPQPVEKIVKDRQHAVELFRKNLYNLLRPGEIEELRGKNLACWCPLDQPCHVDVYLELANEETKAT
jgi:hypothetical protein